MCTLTSAHTHTHIHTHTHTHTQFHLYTPLRTGNNLPTHFISSEQISSHQNRTHLILSLHTHTPLHHYTTSTHHHTPLHHLHTTPPPHTTHTHTHAHTHTYSVAYCICITDTHKFTFLDLLVSLHYSSKQTLAHHLGRSTLCDSVTPREPRTHTDTKSHQLFFTRTTTPLCNIWVCL